MKNRNRIRVLTALLLLAALLLAACGSPGAGTAPAEPAPTAAPTEAPTPEATPAPTEAPTPAATETAAPAPAAERTVVECETVEAFLKAIAPDTTIRLTGRSYDLSAALGYGNFSGDHYDWLDLYDGWELVISGVDNLRIEAARPGTEIVTLPRYADVIRFDNCSNITLSGLTVGHTEGAGTCAGSVLRMLDCRDMQVENCELYGCGTYGLELDRCRNLSCRETVIRDCTYGALSASSSSGVVLDGCRISGISENSYMAVLSLSNCSGCAMINSLVRSCAASELLNCRYVRDFYLGGCEIVSNRFGGMFYATNYPITVDGCSFKKNELENGWYSQAWGGDESEKAVDPDGRPYEGYELSELKLKTDVTWTPPELAVPEQKPVEASSDGMIHVSTVDELLASIAPGATIYLEDGVYSLAEATGYGTYTGDTYYWMPCYDGPGLVISGVSDLTITAGGPHRVTVTAEPRYANVLSFENCSGLTLKNITAGHTQEPGSCSGGVLNFQNCSACVVQDCSLYGCGILGVSGYSCSDLTVRYTEIHDCSDGAFDFTSCSRVTIDRCNIHDIGGPTYFIYDCKNVTVNGKTVPDGTSW